MRILKFGGSSISTPDRVRHVAGIIAREAEQNNVGIVVSAFGGITDLLIEAADAAAIGDDRYRVIARELRERHESAAEELAGAEGLVAVRSKIDAILDEFDDRLHGISLVGECSLRTRDSVLSCGERLSSILVAAALEAKGVAAEACDARNLILTDSNYGNARVDFEVSFERINAHFAEAERVQIVTGFISRDKDSETTTLGRGGSDFTAALLGAALSASSVEIWTDVDGVMSADPRLVTQAFSLPSLSYDELMELSHFGAKVVYPPTVRPARTHHIPLLIRNTLNPGFSGTRIVERSEGNGHPVRGISSINDIALLRLEGDGMVGVPGIAKRLFGALARREISVVLISQASSEHSICFAVEPASVESARIGVEAEFELERRDGFVNDLVIEKDFSVIAVVGEAMSQIPGIAGKVFSVLGENGVNVRAIAQGSSELNISLVVDRRQEARALNAIHDAFFPELAPSAAGRAAASKIPVAILGATGTVGQRMIAWLEDHPWFTVKEVIASEASAGKRYRDAVRWLLPTAMPPDVGDLVVQTLDASVKSPLVLSALDASLAGPVEPELAANGHLVVSNAGAHRMRADVPLLIPEVNPDHLGLIEKQPYQKGAIVTNPNCSTIGLVLALKPLADAFGLGSINVVTMQAASGAGFPGVSSLELIDNLVPFIGGEEEKLESEARKILGRFDGHCIDTADITVSAQCNRVAVLDGHTVCVSLGLQSEANSNDIIEAWSSFSGQPQHLGLPSAPLKPLIYDHSPLAPQPRLHRLAGRGMAVTIGRLRPCAILGHKFVLVSHNTIRGAAGGAILAAEMSVAQSVVAGLAPPAKVEN